MEQCHELLYKTDAAGTRRSKKRAPAALGMMLGTPGHLSAREGNVFFNLSARLYRQNKISCRGLLIHCLWLFHVLI